MTAPTDAQLWQRAARGDASAFGQIYERHDRSVTAYCLWKTGDAAAAEDLKQMVFLEAWRIRTRTSLTTPSARPLLLGIANNVARNQWRSKRRYRAALERLGHRAEPQVDIGGDTIDRLAAADRLGALRTQLAAMPKHEREVLVLIALAELSYDEVAEMVGVPVGTVRSRLSRARARLTAAPLTDPVPTAHATSPATTEVPS